MTFTQEEIEDIKSECFANDVDYNYEVLKDWDEDKIRDYFESGGGGEGSAPSAVTDQSQCESLWHTFPCDSCQQSMIQLTAPWIIS